MLSQIKHWFVPPVFEHNREKTRIASLLNTVLLAYLAVELMSSIALIVADDPTIGALAVGAMVLSTLVPLALMRLGYVRLAGGIFCSAMWSFNTGIMFISGGVTSPIMGGYIVVTLIAALLVSGKATFVFAGLSITAAVSAFAAESRGTLPSLIMPPTPIIALSMLIGSIIPAAAFVYLATRSLHNALAHARDNERQLSDSNHQLQDTRRSLQEHNDQLQTVVEQYVAYMAQVGQGELSDRLHLDGNRKDGLVADDPLLVLGHQLNETVASLQRMASRVREGANRLNSAAAEILATTTQQAAGATEQSAAVSQATTTVDEVKTIAEQLVARSQTVADAAQHTVQFSRTGQEMSHQTLAGMFHIKTRVDLIEENILALSEQTQQIDEIIDTVNAIASQSNLLALNAAVEAARAGEQGKGFAVVAQEVRDLAKRSAQATVQVKAILSDIQKATASTTMATEEGKKGVDAGMSLVEQMQNIIDQLTSVIDKSAKSAVQMSTGGQQQTSGMEQITVTMNHIHQVTMQNMASTKQAERSAQELNDLANSLTEVVAQYQL